MGGMVAVEKKRFAGVRGMVTKGMVTKGRCAWHAREYIF